MVQAEALVAIVAAKLIQVKNNPNYKAFSPQQEFCEPSRADCIAPVIFWFNPWLEAWRVEKYIHQMWPWL